MANIGNNIIALSAVVGPPKKYRTLILKNVKANNALRKMPS